MVLEDFFDLSVFNEGVVEHFGPVVKALEFQ